MPAASSSDHGWPLRAVVGYDDGSWALYTLNHGDSQFTEACRHQRSSRGAIVALAYTHPYMVVLDADHWLSAYFITGSHSSNGDTAFALDLLCSLKSHTAQAPLSISLRKSPAALIASIVSIFGPFAASCDLSVGINTSTRPSQKAIRRRKNILLFRRCLNIPVAIVSRSVVSDSDGA